MFTEVHRKGCRRHVRTCKIHFFFFFSHGRIHTARVGVHLRVCAWSGFEVDPRRGAFRMAGESLPAIALLRSTVETRAHTRTRAQGAHVQTRIVHTRGRTHSWRQSQTKERQYSMRQESGLQSTIPASSYQVACILTKKRKKKTDLTRLAESVLLKTRGTHTFIFPGCLSRRLQSRIAISHDVKSLFHHLQPRCNGK